MKKSGIVLLCMVGFFACKQEKNTFTLDGHIERMEAGELYFVQSGKENDIDTVKVVNGRFVYKGILTEPTVYMINFGENEQPAFVILEPGHLTLRYEKDNSRSLRIQGGKEQTIYSNFMKACEPTINKMDSIGRVAGEYEYDSIMMKQLTVLFNQYDAILRDEQLAFIHQHSNDIATAFIAINYLNAKQSATSDEVQSIYTTLSQRVQQTFYGKKLASLLQLKKNTDIGQLAPDFILPDINNKPISLSSFKGNITLLDFWASWCSPCRAENPNVVNAYKKYHPKGLEILGVSLDSKKENWRQAIAHDQLTWAQVSELSGWDGKVAAQFGIQSIPSNFLLDKEGRIIGKDLREAELMNKLDELFK